MSANEEVTHQVTKSRIDLLVREMHKFGGEVFTIAGDGVVAEFGSAVNALRLAIHIQQRFAALNARRAGQAIKIEFRIGINVGDLVLHKGAIGGDSANVAVRIEALAEPGGICISRAVFEQVHRTLHLEYTRIGKIQLKNIPIPVEVFQVRRATANHGPTQGAQGTARQLVTSERPSIAILPFQDMSPGSRETYFADGVTDDIITGLSRFRELFIIGRNSSFVYRERQARLDEIARELGVRYVLDGNLRRSAERIRVTAHLIEGLTGHQLWSEQYDSTLPEVFSIEADVLQMIVARLAVRVTSAELERIRRIETSHMEAYGYVLRGQELVNECTRDTNLRARSFYELAASLDATYARAYSGLSRTYNFDWKYSWADQPEEALDTALVLAKKAVGLDPTDSRAYSELGFAYLYRKRVDLAIASYRRALELNPNDADAMAELADALVYDDQNEQALELFDRAMQLNPYYPDWYLHYRADALSSLGRYEETIAVIQSMNEPLNCARMMTAALAHLGRLSEARTYASLLLERYPNFSISRWAAVPPYKNPEQISKFMQGLRLAGLPE
jgi:TolB-like protein